MSLVFESDLNLLLRGRNDLVFCGTLQARKLGHRQLDDVQRLLDLLLCDNQRRSQADDVLVGGFGLGKLSAV